MPRLRYVPDNDYIARRAPPPCFLAEGDIDLRALLASELISVNRKKTNKVTQFTKLSPPLSILFHMLAPAPTSRAAPLPPLAHYC
jgi:hypothetical protein